MREFIAFSQSRSKDGIIRCHCTKHKNGPYLAIDDVRVYLYRRESQPRYWCWTSHGEVESITTTTTNVHVESSSSS